jgi:hypothetical protein
MEPDGFFGALITIRRSKVGSPGEMALGIPGISAPFQGKPFALAHLVIDDQFDNPTSLFHGRGESFRDLALSAVIPSEAKKKN